MRLIPSPQSLLAAGANVAERLRAGHLADLRPWPRTLIDEGPQRSVYHMQGEHEDLEALPVLLVPPLAAPATAFDLRRGCSMVEHLVGTRRPTYLVDYGPITFADRSLGIEHWIDQVVPRSIEAVSRHAGGRPVHLVGWCLGGIFSLFTVAARPRLPVASVIAVASPFDVTAVPLLAPLRPLVRLTDGRVVTAIYRTLGGAPAPIVRTAFQLSSVDKYLTKPLAVAQHLDDRDFLEQIEAVDAFTAGMLAYPGRTFGQLYHRFFRANDLREGHLDLGGRRLELAEVRVPVLVVAGAGDTIAPKRAVHRLTELLVHSPEVVYEVAPGGHLGVLAGRGARRTTWRHLDGFLAAHDQPRPRRRRRAAAGEPAPPPKAAARPRPRRAGKPATRALITERAVAPGEGTTHGHTDRDQDPRGDPPAGGDPLATGTGDAAPEGRIPARGRRPAPRPPGTDHRVEPG
jgi:polyhydroxyalkanoate synthase